VAEETLWRGNVSQWKNFGFFVLQLLLAAAIVILFVMVWRQSSDLSNFAPYILILLAVPIFIAGKRYLQTKCKIYELTSERLKMREGVFSKVTDTLELYRVKDIETQQPFVYRLCGIENVQLNTSDTSSPFVLIQAIRTVSDWGTKSETKSKSFVSKRAFAKSTLSERGQLGSVFSASKPLVRSVKARRQAVLCLSIQRSEICFNGAGLR